MSHSFKKWYFDSERGVITTVKEQISVNEQRDLFYNQILGSDGLPISVKSLKYPRTLSVVNNNSSNDQQQYISSVPVDVPFEYLENSTDSVYMGLLLKDFYHVNNRNDSIVHEKKVQFIEDVHDYHVGIVKESDDFLGSIKHSAAFEESSSGFSIKLYDILDSSISAS